MELKPGYKQTEVGVIPDDWEKKFLSQVTKLLPGFPFSSVYFSKDVGIRLLRGENVGYGCPDWSSTQRFPRAMAQRLRPYELNPGDVIIGMDRTFTKAGAKVSRLRIDDCPCLLVQRVGKFEPFSCSLSFIWAFSSYSGFHKQLKNQQKGMDIPHLSCFEILHTLIAMPPTTAEQEAIAGALSDTDALIEALEQLITKKRHIKQGAMQELLTGKKRLPGFETKPGTQQTEVGEIPADWRVLPFNEIAFLERGKFSARPRNDPKYFGGETPFIQTGDVTNSNGFIRSASQTLNDEGVKVSKIFPAGSLFFTIAANIGDVAFAMMATACTDSLVVIKMKSCVDEFWLAHEIGRRKRDFENLATQNAQANINLEKLRPILFHFPPKKEQEAIAAVLSDMDAEISALETKLTKARHIKQGMMAELLTGRIRLI